MPCCVKTPHTNGGFETYPQHDPHIPLEVSDNHTKPREFSQQPEGRMPGHNVRAWVFILGVLPPSSRTRILMDSP